MNPKPQTQTPQKTYINGISSTSAHVEGGKTISPANLSATISLSNGAVIEFASLSMISISSHREKFPVTELGTVGPIGYTKGHRLIAGTLVFSIFDRSAFSAVLSPLEAIVSYGSTNAKNNNTPNLNFFDTQADELPPFDIHMIYSMEDGTLCYEGLRGLTILDFGSVRSIDMLQTQESYSYFAREVIPLQRLTDYITGRNFTPSNVEIATTPGKNNSSTLTNTLPSTINSTVQNTPVSGQYSQVVTVSTTSSGPLSGIPIRCVQTNQVLNSQIGGVTFTQPLNTGSVSYVVDGESIISGRGSDGIGAWWPIAVNQMFSVPVGSPATLNVSTTLI